VERHWLVRYLVKRAAWVVLAAGAAFLLAATGVDAATSSVAPIPQVLAVPCDGPDDPPGCDPEETPTPTPTATPTATPTPTPAPTSAVVELGPETLDWIDERYQLGSYMVVLAFFVIIATATGVLVVTGLRRV